MVLEIAAEFILPIAGAALLGFAVHWFTKPKHNHLPPGPNRYPIIGNLLNFPRDHFYAAFTRWQKEYGDVVYASFLGQPIYVINSREKAEDLLSKRGNVHSGRPQQILPRYLMGWEDWNVALVQPGKAHSELRALLMKGLSTSVIPSYDAMIEQIVNEQVLKLFVGQVLEPRDLIEEAVAEVLVRIGYGDTLSKEQKKELLEANRIALKYTLESNTTGLVLLLDVAPFLRFYPRWLPGGGFRNWTAYCKRFVEYIRFKPWESVLQDVQDGVVRESLASRLISHEGPTERVRDVLAFLYFTGAETTTTAILTAVYVLLMYPEVQAKAHAELDAVLGHERTPTASDRARLPYLDALWRESLRWHPPGPVNIPHVSTKDDVWEGYFIPKGSSIFVNSGFILRDPRVWGDADTFRPERLLGKEGPPFDPLTVVFGFGRRNCPGRYLADRQGFIFIAAILWAFKIEPAPGETRLDPSKASFIDSLAAAPEPFRCAFVPRSRKLEEYCKNL